MRRVTSNTKTEFGKWLRDWRSAKGLTLDQLGILIGSDGPVIGNLERGIRNPSRDMVERLAAALGVDPDPGLLSAGYAAIKTPAPDPVSQDVHKQLDAARVALEEATKAVQRETRPEIERLPFSEDALVIARRYDNLPPNRKRIIKDMTDEFANPPRRPKNAGSELEEDDEGE